MINTLIEKRINLDALDSKCSCDSIKDKLNSIKNDLINSFYSMMITISKRVYHINKHDIIHNETYNVCLQISTLRCSDDFISIIYENNNYDAELTLNVLISHFEIRKIYNNMIDVLMF